MSAEYLALQAAQQKRHAEIAAKLGLDDAQATLTSASPNTAAAKARQVRAAQPAKPRKRPIESADPVEGTRKSARGGAYWSEEQANAQRAAEEHDREEDEQRKWAEKHGEKGLNPVQHKVLAGSTQAETDKEELLSILREAGDVTVPFVVERDNSAENFARLAATAESMVLRGTVRATQGRVYSLIVHPTLEKDLLFVGDKVGHIGLWDATEAGKQEPAQTNGAIRDRAEGDEAEAEAQDDVGQTSFGKHWHWRVHAEDKAVSCLKYRPNHPRSLYSASHDCTMRVTDLETGGSEEILDGDHFKDDCFYHSFDFSLDGNQLWAADSMGGLTFRDMREPRLAARRFNIDRSRISSVQLNPANQWLAATAHLKGTMRLWDVRKLMSMPEDATDEMVNTTAKIAQFTHNRRCSSAYFDFSGTKMLGTSYNEEIHLFDINPTDPEVHRPEGAFLPAKTIIHPNMVGRDITEFKAAWSQCPTQPLHFTVGSMSREVDIFNPDYSLESNVVAQLWEPNAITAIQAVTVCHPLKEGHIFTGNAAGKTAFWAAPYGA